MGFSFLDTPRLKFMCVISERLELIRGTHMDEKDTRAWDLHATLPLPDVADAAEKYTTLNPLLSARTHPEALTPPTPKDWGRYWPAWDANYEWFCEANPTHVPIPGMLSSLDDQSPTTEERGSLAPYAVEGYTSLIQSVENKGKGKEEWWMDVIDDEVLFNDSGDRNEEGDVFSSKHTQRAGRVWSSSDSPPPHDNDDEWLDVGDGPNIIMAAIVRQFESQDVNERSSGHGDDDDEHEGPLRGAFVRDSTSHVQMRPEEGEGDGREVVRGRLSPSLMFQSAKALDWTTLGDEGEVYHIDSLITIPDEEL